MSVIDEKALDERIRRIAREEAMRPAFVHQRNVEAVIGLPRRDFLRLARAAAFPATKERRVVLARTADVLAYVEERIPRRPPARVLPTDDEATALARVGARRVGVGPWEGPRGRT